MRVVRVIWHVFHMGRVVWGVIVNRNALLYRNCVNLGRVALDPVVEEV